MNKSLISYNELKVNVKSVDIFYYYKIKIDKIIKREEKVIIITNNEMEKRLKYINYWNFFMDVTYKIIPKSQKNYNLLTITGIEKITKNSYICTLILKLMKIFCHL